MHVSQSHDPRPEPLARIRALVADLERATPPRIVLAGLVDAAKRIRLRLGEPIRPRRRRRRRARS